MCSDPETISLEGKGLLVVINTEIQSRELSGNLLLASFFANLGGSTLILDQSTLPEVLPQLPRNGIFHAKSLESSKVRANQHEQLLRMGYSITAQDQEHGLLVKDYDLTARQRFTGETMSRVTKYFGWGPLDTETLKVRFPEFRENIIETGSPRLDLARMGRRSHPDIGSNQTSILLISSIESHSPSRYWEILKNMKKLSETDRAPELVDQKFNYWADEIRAIPRILRFLSMVTDELPGTSIVIRPHFSEDPTAWETLTSENSSIKVESQETIGEALSKSDVVLHYGSTVAIESLLSGVPPIALPLSGISENTLTPFSNAVSIQPETLEQVLAEIRKIRLGHKPNLDKQMALLASRFRVQGPPSSSIIAKEWKKILLDKGSQKLSAKQVGAIRKALSRSEKRIKRNAARAAHSGLQQSAQQKFPPLRPERINSIFTSLAVSHQLKPAHLQLLSSRAVLISP